MDRRRFIGTDAAGGAGLTLGAAGCAPRDGAETTPSGGGARVRPFELDELDEIADRLDAERRESGPRGPLHGIPEPTLIRLASAFRQATNALRAPTYAETLG